MVLNKAYNGSKRRNEFLLRIEKLLEILFIPIVGTCLILGFFDISMAFLPLILFLIFYVIVGFFRKSCQTLKSNILIHGLILFYLLVELITYYTSVYSPNSLQYLIRVLTFVCLYYFISQFMKTRLQAQSLFVFLSSLAIFFSLLTLMQFNFHQYNLERVGFTEYIHFKNLFYPFANLINEWSTVFLMLLPFPIGLYLLFRDRKYMWLLPFGMLPILMVIIVSFSRGVYLALFVWWLLTFILFLLFKIVTLKKILIFNVVTVVVMAIFIFPFTKSTLKTAKGFSTTSQVRSFSSRLNIWENSLKIVNEHPIVGVGSYNFPIAYAAFKDKNEDTAFVAKGFNTFMQLLVEKGIIGLCSFLLLCGGFFWISLRKLRNKNLDVSEKGILLLFMITVFALLVRDLSYSTLLYHDGVCLLFWLMLAYNAKSFEVNAAI